MMMKSLTTGKPVETPSPSLRVEDLTVAYDGHVVLKEINLSYAGKGLILVLGPNGSGKTTLLKTIAGMIRPLSGRVVINGLDVTGNPDSAGRMIGYVPQLISSEKGHPITVGEMLEYEAKFYHRRWPRLIGKIERSLIENVMDMVGLDRSLWNKSFWDLSGGQKQRVLIARALLKKPPLLLMDEPLSSIDPKGRGEVSKLIGQLSRKSLIIVTSHDPVLLIKYTDRILLLGEGFYAYGKPEEILCMDVLEKVYGESAVRISDTHVHIADNVCRRQR